MTLLLLKLNHRSEFFKNIVTLLTGSAIAQLIPLLASPILTRLYTPEQFGEFALFFGVINILSIIACGRYELAIVVPKEENDAAALSMLSIQIAAGVSAIITLASLVVAFLNINTGLPDIALFLIGPSVFCVAVSQVAVYALLRRKKFTNASLNKVSQTGFSTLGVISLFNSAHGLVIGDFVGRIFYGIVSFFQLKKVGYLMNISNSEKLKKAKQFDHFPRFNSIPALLDTFAVNIPLFVITSLFSTTLTGFFNITRQYIGSPLSLISSSVSQVYFPLITSKLNNGEKIKGDFLKLSLRLFLLACFSVLAVVFFAKPAFAFLFGDEWIQAAEFARILIFSFAVRFAVSPLSVIFPALQKVKVNAIWQVSYFAVLCTLFFLNVISITDFLWLYVVLEIIMYGVYYSLIYQEVLKHDRTS